MLCAEIYSTGKAKYVFSSQAGSLAQPRTDHRFASRFAAYPVLAESGSSFGHTSPLGRVPGMGGWAARKRNRTPPPEPRTHVEQTCMTSSAQVLGQVLDG